MLTACSSGSGGTDVTIGSGQNGDPVTLDFPVFYVKRPVPDPDDDDVMERRARAAALRDRRRPVHARPRLAIRAGSQSSPPPQTEGLGDIRDVDVSFDGSKVVFSMRAPVHRGRRRGRSADLEHLGIRRRRRKALRRIIAVGHDRRRRPRHHAALPARRPHRVLLDPAAPVAAILLDENKPQYAAQDEGRRTSRRSCCT